MVIEVPEKDTVNSLSPGRISILTFPKVSFPSGLFWPLTELIRTLSPVQIIWAVSSRARCGPSYSLTVFAVTVQRVRHPRSKRNTKMAANGGMLPELNLPVLFPFKLEMLLKLSSGRIMPADPVCENRRWQDPQNKIKATVVHRTGSGVQDWY